MDDVIKNLMKDLKLDYNENTWVVHGKARVVLHKALEKIAAHKGIKFDAPAMIANDPEKKIAAMCVTGHLGDRVEWAIGAASPSNNKNNYPYAMAEKRAKDRVILKLLNMAGDYYSQEEADQFEEAKPKEIDEPRKKAPEPEPQPDPEPAPEPQLSDEIRNWANQVNDSIENKNNMEKPGKYSAEQMFIDQYNRLIDDLDDCKQQSHLNAWKEKNRQWLDRFQKDKPKEYQEILGWFKVKKGQIEVGNLSSIREDIPI